MADLNGVKMEDDVKIKLDPDQMSIADDEADEDTGDLTFPPPRQTVGTSDGLPQVWLIRTPRDLWNGLSKMKHEKPVRIGEIHTWSQPGKPPKVRWRIRKDVDDSFELIAKDYDLQVQAEAPHNTFVFSEKDLPGFKPNAAGRRFGVRDPIRKTEGGKIEKRQRGPRAITKHTTYIDAPQCEVLCNPRETDEWLQIRREKDRRAREKKEDTKMMNINAARLQMMAGQQGDRFFRGAEPKKTKTQALKHQRLEESQLIDELLKCFGEHRYWHLKNLKIRLKQPEAHLRDVLQKIAVLIKSGQTANTWTLNRTTAAMLESSGEDADAGPDIAPDMGDDDVDDDDDDDEDEMEDVEV